jgi:drug/metabolite transporter (DMT)-like permease
MGITFGLISALSFGISNAYWKKAAQDVDYVFLVLFRGLIAVSVFGLCWLIMAFGTFDVEYIINRNATAADYLNAFMICGFCSLGLYFFLKSMKYAPVSITVALSTVNIFGILTTVLIVGERFDLIYVLAFFLAITGILLAQKLNWEGSVFQWNKGATYALLASLF